MLPLSSATTLRRCSTYSVKTPRSRCRLFAYGYAGGTTSVGGCSDLVAVAEVHDSFRLGRVRHRRWGNIAPIRVGATVHGHSWYSNSTETNSAQSTPFSMSSLCSRYSVCH